MVCEKRGEKGRKIRTHSFIKQYIPFIHIAWFVSEIIVNLSKKMKNPLEHFSEGFLLSGKIITVMFQNSDTLMFYQILIPYMLSIILNNVMMINIIWHNNILNVFKNHFWELVRELYLLQRLLIELVLKN